MIIQRYVQDNKNHSFKFKSSNTGNNFKSTNYTDSERILKSSNRQFTDVAKVPSQKTCPALEISFKSRKKSEKRREVVLKKRHIPNQRINQDHNS